MSFKITDIEHQNECIAYMYGRSLREADEMRKTLTETEIANANDYMMTDGLPNKTKEEYFRNSVSSRQFVEKKHGLSPIQAIIVRDEMEDLKKLEDGSYDIESDEGKEAACKLYARLEKNNLSSSSQNEMEILETMAKHAGLSFEMTNRSAYIQPNALVDPKFELVETVKEQDFSDAVANISAADDQLEQ